jgi:hypothetical protein
VAAARERGRACHAPCGTHQARFSAPRERTISRPRAQNTAASRCDWSDKTGCRCHHQSASCHDQPAAYPKQLALAQRLLRDTRTWHAPYVCFRVPRPERRCSSHRRLVLGRPARGGPARPHFGLPSAPPHPKLSRRRCYLHRVCVTARPLPVLPSPAAAAAAPIPQCQGPPFWHDQAYSRPRLILGTSASRS